MSARIFPDEIKLSDMLTGAFEPEIWKRRKADTSTPEDKRQIASTTRTYRAKVEIGEWHRVSMTIRGDHFSVSIDGESVGGFSSVGIC